MKLHFKEFKDEIDSLIEFLTSDTWSFHGQANPDPVKIRENYENQLYSSTESKTFWIISDEDTRIGIIRVYDLQDSTPLFDLRILSRYRGTGAGTAAVKWLAEYIFKDFSDKERLEGHTRQDNFAMRCVFHKCGFIKEAHHRKAWRDAQGNLYDSIGYGLTKEDWLNGKVTPLVWNDFKC